MENKITKYDELYHRPFKLILNLDIVRNVGVGTMTNTSNEKYVLYSEDFSEGQISKMIPNLISKDKLFKWLETAWLFGWFTPKKLHEVDTFHAGITINNYSIELV